MNIIDYFSFFWIFSIKNSLTSRFKRFRNYNFRISERAKAPFLSCALRSRPSPVLSLNRCHSIGEKKFWGKRAIRITITGNTFPAISQTMCERVEEQRVSIDFRLANDETLGLDGGLGGVGVVPSRLRAFVALLFDVRCSVFVVGWPFVLLALSPCTFSLVFCTFALLSFGFCCCANYYIDPVSGKTLPHMQAGLVVRGGP